MNSVMDLAPVGSDLGGALVIIAGFAAFFAIGFLVGQVLKVRARREAATDRMRNCRQRFDLRQKGAVEEIRGRMDRKKEFQKLLEVTEI